MVSTSSNLSKPVANSVGVRAAELAPFFNDMLTSAGELLVCKKLSPLSAAVPANGENLLASPKPAIQTYSDELLITSLIKLVDPSGFSAPDANETNGNLSRTAPLVPPIKPSSSMIATCASSDVAVLSEA